MKEKIAELLIKPTGLKEKEILLLIETPKDSSIGDYAFPCFSLAKRFKESPAKIAEKIVTKLKNALELERIEAVNGYVNFSINRLVLAEETLKKIQKEKEKYGSSNLGRGKKILLEMSSPNIAKPFGIGHLRSTIIGNSIGKISELLGFKVVRMNYLGDWGTQFGKLILGYKMFGDSEKLKKDPINHLLEIYVKVNENPELEKEAREWFRKLEYGDEEAYAIWNRFRALSILEFQKVYDLLGIKFDVTSGESLYNKKMEEVVEELQKKNLLIESEGALIVDLREHDLGVVIIKKADGTTIYTTRDIAAAIERHKKYKFDSMFYEVGSEQKLHFEQLFKILELMGKNWAKNCMHVSHGLYLDTDGKKFSTRKGKTVFMEDIISEAKDIAGKEILKREPKTKKKEIEGRANAIALAAIIYGDLKNYRVNDMIFDIERFTSFEGDTGPYLLYSYVRAKSILEKAKFKPKKKYSIHNLNDLEKNLVFQLNKFPQIVRNAYDSLAPNAIANYVFETSQLFNEFYHSNPVIGSENEQFRLILVDSFSQVVKNALSLLGIPIIEKM
jgi:arginyl-tRNA synthetase